VRNLVSRSRADLPEQHWELLVDHLTSVGARAGGHASAFGAQDAGRALGLLHDVGKASTAFQSYIRGHGPSPNHSTAGAVEAVAIYGPMVGRLLAFALAGHHAGLANGAVKGTGPTPLRERLHGSARIPLPPDMPDLPDLAAVAAFLKRGTPAADPAFALSFAIRMLFSCLVDADGRAAAASLGEPESEGNDWPTIDGLNDRLAVYLANLTGDAVDTPVNRIRAEVLAAARVAAVAGPGLFSLTVPTGGGKTLASLAFALEHARRHGLRRVIYVVPYTSIIEQTAAVFRDALGQDAVLEHHSAFDPTKFPLTGDDEGRDGTARLRLAAVTWDAPVVVTTAVQFFESLFANRTTACRKLHAIAKSVVVLDEAQTMPHRLLRPCLEALRELARGYGTSVVLCTATQPAVRVEDGFPGGLADVREIAPEPARLYAALRRVTVERPDAPLTDDEVAALIQQEPQALCIVNSRRHARAVFRRIANLPGARHLTTCQCAAHRRRVLAEIRQDLKQGRPVRLVATSLIEAGVDVSFPLVLRAAAGLDSVAQAAGRCNRNGELVGRLGRVVLFTPADPGDLGANDVRQAAEATGRTLRAHGDDPLGLEAVRHWFGDRFWTQDAAGRLDAAQVGEMTGILPALRERARDLDFPFADVASAFRMIDSPLVPVIVPWRAPGEADVVEGLVKRLPFVASPGGIARDLQPYLVQVPPKARAKLIANRAAEIVAEEKYGDQFVVLTNRDIYFEDVGLDWEDPEFRRVDTSMF
jgi:CRISPR-associated endonuclease/helicase Cas3